MLPVITLLLWLTLATPSESSSKRDRWQHPCSGSNTVIIHVEDDDHLYGESQTDLSHRLGNIATESTYLRSYVRNVINDYIQKRIGKSEAQRIEEEFQFMNSVEPKLTEEFNLEVAANVLFAYEDLAKFSLNLAQMRRDEINEVHHSIHFETEFVFAEEGIYLLLCKLAETMKYMDITLGRKAVENIEQLDVFQANQKSVLHARDLVVLRGLERTLEVVRMAFISMKKSIDS